MLNILIKVILILVLVFLYVRWLENRSFYYPKKEITATPADEGLVHEEIRFSAADGTELAGWLVRADDSGKAVIYCHGNAGNIGNRVLKLRALNEIGLNVFIFDYRGYGNSAGRPSEEGIYLDAMAAYDYLAGRPDIDKESIAVYGVSLGGAAAAELATKRKLAGLVVDSSFTSAKEMAKLLYPFLPSFFMKMQRTFWISLYLESARKLNSLTGLPKLFLHSKEDALVPYSIGEKLYNAAAEPKQFVTVNGLHAESCTYDPETFKQAFREFFKGIDFI